VLPKRAFGRRAGDGQSDPAAIGADSNVTVKFHEASVLFISLSDLLAFAGLLIVFLVSVFWPDDPATLDRLGGRILISEMLGKNVQFQVPHLTHLFLGRNYESVAFMEAPERTLILLVGLLSVFRGRWLFVGCAAAFHIFPWELFGFGLDGSNYSLALLLGVVIFRLLRQKYPKASSAAAVAIWIFPIFLYLPIMGLATLIPKMGQQQGYYSVNYGQLLVDESQLANKSVPPEDRGIRVASMQALQATGSVAQTAKAFVLAQEFALRGDIARTGEAFSQSQSFENSKSIAEKIVMAEIRAYLAANEYFQSEVRDATLKAYQTNYIIAAIIGFVGILVALLGIFGDVVADQISRRATRVREFQKLLAAQQMRPTRAPPGVTVPAPMQQQSGPIASLATDDAVTSMAQMSARIRQYVWLAVILGAIAGLALYVHLVFALPPAQVNTAFRGLGIPAGALNFLMTGKGYSIEEFGMLSTAALVGFLKVSLLFCFALAGWIYARKWTIPGFFAIAAIYSLTQLALNAPPDAEAAPKVLTADARATLLTLATAPTHGNGIEEEAVSSHPGPVFESISKEISPSVSSDESGRNNLQSLTKIISPATAVFVLAQLSYLENDPAVAARHLEKLGKGAQLPGLYARQRIEIIREWVSANGHSAPMPGWAANLRLSISGIREIGEYSLVLAYVMLGMMLVPIGLASFAGRRRAVIGGLVRLRHIEVGNKRRQAVLDRQETSE
jgi:hypothetical protein